MAGMDVNAKLTLDSSNFDANMRKSGEAATATGRATAKAARDGAEARVVAEKFAGDTISEQSIRALAAKRAEAVASQDFNRVQSLVHRGLLDEAEGSRTAAAALQRLVSAKLAVAAASEVQGHASEVSQRMAASAFVRGAESGNVGIRSVENFLTTIPGVGTALQAIFPILGATAFVAILAEMGTKLYEAQQKAAKAAEETRKAFAVMHEGAVVTNDDLRIQNDKLQDEIDKISGKPNNGLHTALDEARKMADQLLLSLRGNRKELEELLKEHSVSGVQHALRMVAGMAEPAGTSKQEEELLADRDKLSERVRKLNEDFDAAISQTSDPSKMQTLAALRAQQIHQIFDPARKALIDEAARLKAEASKPSKQHLTAYGTVIDPAVDNAKKIANVAGNEQMMGDLEEKEIARVTGFGLAIKLAAAKSGKTASEGLNKLEEAQRQSWGNQHAEWAAEKPRTNEDERNWWNERTLFLKQGSKNWEYAVKNANEEEKKVHLDERKQFDEALKMKEEWSKIEWKGASAAIRYGEEAESRDTGHAARAGLELAQAQKDAAYSVANSNIQFGEQSGKLGHLEAATLRQTLNTMRYKEALDKINYLQQNVPEGRKGEAESKELEVQKVKLNADRSAQVLGDAAKVASHSWSGGLEEAMDKFVQYANDSGRQASEVFSTVVGGLNEQLSALLVGKKANFADFFRSIGQQIAMMGLQNLEARATGGLGGFFSGAAGLLSGFRAEGGPVTAGMTYMVGERGKETFTAPSNGFITPNHALGKGGTAGDTHHWNIDARAAQDPAQVHAAVMRAAPHIVAASIRAMDDRRSRSPLSAH